MRAPYPANRLHNQHPQPPASQSRGQPNRAATGGSILDADSPAQGVNFARRNTPKPRIWQTSPADFAGGAPGRRISAAGRRQYSSFAASHARSPSADHQSRQKNILGLLEIEWAILGGSDGREHAGEDF